MQLVNLKANLKYKYHNKLLRSYNHNINKIQSLRFRNCHGKNHLKCSSTC